MILLWGVEQDSTLAAVREALGRRGAPVFLLDQTRASETALEWSAENHVAGQIRLAGTVCDLLRVTAAYVRPYQTRTVVQDPDPAIVAHADRLDAAAYGFLEVTPARVVNPAEAMATNGSKPYQLAIIAAHGFGVPDTLITTDPEAVLAFQARHGQIIYKSISGVRSIVRRFAAEDAERLADIGWCPTQFQQYVPGRDYRVHIVGEDVFTSEIVSDADDYRYAARQGETAEILASRIPEPLEQRCRALARSLGLWVAGIDLRLTPGGAWHCFEVNPSPAFSYYESATGQPIAASVARLLDSETSP